MKVCVICLAYLEKPEGVELLCRYFSKLDADVYLHIDKKVSNESYLGLPTRALNLVLIEDRFPIFWGGFNTIKAIINSLNYARSASKYDRFILITEDTVPLLNPSELSLHLERNVEFMNIFSAGEANWINDRYKNYFHFDSCATNPRWYPPEEKIITDQFLDDMVRLKSLKIQGKVPIDNLFIASTWWALTNIAVNQILNIFNNDRWLRESFEFSSIPEEIFFPTILKSRLPHLEFQPFIFIDFSREPKPFCYDRYEELAALIDSGMLFARKVQIGADGPRRFLESLIDLT